jgi:DNA-binding LytR/AlgR family response regulator
MAEQPCTAIVAEDEALLRNALVELLHATWPQLRIVAECEDGASALEALAEHKPDVAFLDIRMPGLTGLDVAAAAAETSPRTQIVFATAYDQYAIDAFERGAVDYLLKPINAERLAHTVRRLQTRTGNNEAAALAALLARLNAAPAAAQAPAAPPLTWLTASNGRETQLILVDDVAYFRADKQIHRSTIVNLKAIAGIARDDSGRGTVRLKARPETLTVSVPYMALFKHM